MTFVLRDKSQINCLKIKKKDTILSKGTAFLFLFGKILMEKYLSQCVSWKREILKRELVESLWDIHCTQAECGYPTQFTISRDFELIMPGLWCKHLEFAPKCRPCRVAVVGGPRLNAFRKNFVIRIVGGAG